MNQDQRNEKLNALEDQLAKETIELLKSGEPLQQPDDQQVFELGQLIRQSASFELPDPNPGLRQQLLGQIEDAGPDKTVLRPKHSDGHARKIWAIAAALVLGIGAWSLYYVNPEILPVADNDGLKYQEQDESFNHPGNGGNSIISPMTTRSEERTREVPVNRSRIETRLKELADGSFVQKQVEVPYTENVNQNYTVQVPYTENPSKNHPDPDTWTAKIKRRARFEPIRPQDDASVFAAPDSGMTVWNGEVSESVTLSSENSVIAVPDGGTVLMGGIKRPSPGETAPEVAMWNGAQRSYGKRDELVLSLAVDEGQSNAGWMDHGSTRFVRGDGSGLGFEVQKHSEQYAPIHENEFIGAIGGNAISTFSIDVDTAAYANMRRFINSGQLPPRDAVRIEELINYFQYDYPQPKGDDPFSVNMELATCPWNSNHKLLRIGLKGQDVHVKERPATNLVFLLDVSGSMNSPDKLPLLKRGFQMMVNKLTENDRVAIVTYAGNAGVALEPTSGDQKQKINEAIEILTPGGSTHGSAGIELAYKLAQTQFIKDGVNKVILATDGDLNVGITEDSALVKLIKNKSSEDVFLTVLGFGTGNLKDAKMERLADNGNGMYAYIDSIREARKVLVEQMSGSLVTIAKDVKIQIEFNPAEVKAYRLIGYENRMLATEDFDDDKKDAGEIGAGHTVTAIYELVTTDEANEVTTAAVADLKYQPDRPVEEIDQVEAKLNLSLAANSGELLTLALRFKQPDSNTSKRIEFTLKNDEKSFASASNDFRFAASVASFGMLLRGSKHAGNANPDMIQEIATGSLGNDKSGYRAEFIDLVRKTGAICD